MWLYVLNWNIEESINKMEDNVFKTLGVASFDEKIFICYNPANNKSPNYRIDYSTDGKIFKKFSEDCNIEGIDSSEKLLSTSAFTSTKTEDIYKLLYLSESNGHKYLNQARSADFSHWKEPKRLFPITEPAISVPYFKHKDQSVIFFGGNCLNVGLSEDDENWNIIPLANTNGPKLKKELNNHLRVGSVKETGEGFIATYFLEEKHEDHSHFSIWIMTIDINNPVNIKWHSDNAYWHAPQEWVAKPITPVGIVEFRGTYYSYWEYKGKGVFCVVHSPVEEYAFSKSELPHAELIRFLNNPIITPSDNLWESKQVFNAAAVYHDEKVHLLYRAIGEHDTSVLGYATSSNGVNVDGKFSKPAYIPREEFEHPNYGMPIKLSPFVSGGGGYGGIEDPRITKIEDKFYLTYIAYNGKSEPRVALTYISVKDFENKNWKAWAKPVLISPPGVVDKNASVLSEKIGGKYVIFHRIYPDILIDFVDNLDFDGKNLWLKGEYRIHPRPNFWDSKKVGIGPPPIKTKDGWLAIYQAVGFDHGVYKIGAMLLDLNDPTKVLYRSSRPILEPVVDYENSGFKPGVVYPCGAVVIDGKLIVYYGASDTYIAAAIADLNEFLDGLKFDNSPHLDRVDTDFLPNFNVKAI